MIIRTKLKNKRRQKEIKRYYRKPSLTKIILIRGITVLFVFAIIMTAVLFYMHSKFVDNNKQSASSCFDLFQTQEEIAYSCYLSNNSQDIIKGLEEKLGHKPTADELKDQYTQHIRRWFSLNNPYEDSSVNLYDENFNNGIMNFDKPYLSLKLPLFDDPEARNLPNNSYIFYTFQNEDISAKLNEIRNLTHLDKVLIHMDGYYVKGTEFIPKNLYFGTKESNTDLYSDLNNLFVNSEIYEDTEYDSVDRVIHLDTGCGTKENMEVHGYLYIDSHIEGYWNSVITTLTPIYPISLHQIDDQQIALKSFDHAKLMDTTLTTTRSSYSYDHSIDTWGIENISYANIVRGDQAFKRERLNLVYRYKIDFWDDICWYYKFTEDTIPVLGCKATNKNVFMTGCLISGLMWILITFILSALEYQKKKNIYDMNIYQRDLTNIMAHDLKTPLMVIRGSAENLQDEGSNEYIETIINKTDYMSNLISRILSLSKLESNREKMKSKDVNFKNIINDIIEKYTGETDSRNIDIVVAESDNILTVKGDPFWLSEALSNLIDNAIKYSPDDSKIKIEINEKHISIRNKMIDPDINGKKIENLKKSFMRGDNSRSGQAGNGLGLTIAENILSRNDLSLTLKKDRDEFVAIIY